MHGKTVNGKNIILLIVNDIVFVLDFAFPHIQCLHKKDRKHILQL